MATIIHRGYTSKDLKRKISEINSSKRFDAQKHLGKVEWNEDALAYQKRLREEWNNESFLVMSGVNSRHH